MKKKKHQAYDDIKRTPLQLLAACTLYMIASVHTKMCAVNFQ